MFIGFGILLFILSLLSVITDNKLKKITTLIAFALTVMSALRYASGSDYFSYAYFYLFTPADIATALETNLHTEIGFTLLIMLFRNLKFSYAAFIAFCAVISIALFYIPIYKKSRYPLVSLTIFYFIYMFIYIHSGIRQGMAMAVVFYAITLFDLDKDKVKIALYILLASTLHTTAITLLLVFPLLYVMPADEKAKMSTNIIISLLAFVAALVFNLTHINTILLSKIGFFNRFTPYFTGNASIMSLFTKLILFAIITYLYYSSEGSHDKKTTSLYHLYFVGTVIYFVFSNIPIFSRVLDYFTMFELILVPVLLAENKFYYKKFINAGIYLMALLFLFVKDQGALTVQENYFNTGPLAYSYVTIFDKDKVREIKPYDRLEYLLPRDFK